MTPISYSRLAAHDVVVTTYNIVGKEVVVDEKDKNGEQPIKDDEDLDSKDESGV